MEAQIKKIFLFAILALNRCEGEQLADAIMAANKSSLTRIRAMVSHPTLKDSTLAVMGDENITSVNLTSLEVVQLSAGKGNINGNLSESKFKYPIDIVKVAEDKYVISDAGNHRLRKLVYTEREQIVDYLIDSDITSPREMVMDMSRQVLYVIYNTGKAMLKVNVNSGAKIGEFEVTYDRMLSLTPSLNQQNLIYVLAIQSDAVKVVELNTENDQLSEIISLKTVNSSSELQDGHFESDETAVYHRCNEQSFWRFSVIRQVGHHLWTFMCQRVYDLDLHAKTVTEVSKFASENGVGSLAYVIDPLSPRFLFTCAADAVLTKYHVDECITRRRERPPVYSYSWLRTGGYGCKNIDQHKIETLSYMIGQAVADAQASTCVAPQSCFSVCKKKCEEMDSCVAFQCDSRDELCTLSKCALISDLPATYLSCYRLADVVYSQPNP